MKGWVYVITTKSMPNFLKVGFSTKDPELRASELNNTGNPYPYIVEYDVLVNEPKNIEQIAHNLLKDFHENKEWFNCSIETAIIAIKKAANGEIFLENCRFNIPSVIEKNVDENNKKASKLRKTKKIQQIVLQENGQLELTFEENRNTYQKIGKFFVKDGIAIDSKMKLMWLRFSHGQIWQDNTAINRAKGESWREAFEVTKRFNAKGGYAGYVDWRLPTIDELQTLIEKVKCEDGNHISNQIFPNSRSSVWSSSLDAVILDFNSAKVYQSYKKDLSTIRLVRDLTDDFL